MQDSSPGLSITMAFMAAASLVQLPSGAAFAPASGGGDHRDARGARPMTHAMGCTPVRRIGRRRPWASRAGLRDLLVGGLVLAGLGAGLAESSRAEPRSPAARAGPPPVAAVDDRWRARGVAFIDLPMGLRARYEAQALYRLGPGREPATAFLEPTDGASRIGTRLLESRFALTRAVASHVELELAWSARSPLSMVDLLRIEDQRLAALIRFVP
jgi:hypothetical protein